MNKQEIQAIIDAAIAAGATVTELPAAGKGKGKGKGKDKPVDLSTPIGDDTPADDDMVDGEPEAPAALPPVVPSAATGRSDVQYVIGSKAAVIVERPTLQRGSSKAVGAAWRATAVVGTNIRAVKLALLMELAEPFTHAEALAALAPLKANGTIGSGTPASCIRAFVKAGYLEVA